MMSLHSIIIFYNSLKQLQTSRRCLMLQMHSKDHKHASHHWPGSVPLLAINPAISSGLLSMCSSFMQPINSLVPKGKLSGTLGTPPRNNGPVRSRDLSNTKINRNKSKYGEEEMGLWKKCSIIFQGWMAGERREERAMNEERVRKERGRGYKRGKEIKQS